MQLLFALMVISALIGSAKPKVHCQACSTANGKTCTGIVCEDEYCMYVGATVNGASGATLSCVPTNLAIFPDLTLATPNGGCQKKTIATIEYAYEICNNGDYCDFHCSGSTLSLLLPAVVLPVIYLLKL